MHRAPLFCAVAVAIITAINTPTATAQYMFLDTNGNATSDAGDTLNASGATSVDVWLKTNTNRSGGAVSCPTGEPLSMFSYEFLLHVTGGTVSWGLFTNRITEFTTTLGGEFSSALDYRAGRSGTTTLTPGSYRLASVSVTVASGNPFISIAARSPLGEGFTTSFGSQCPTAEFDFTMQFGRDWFDADGAGNRTLWTTGGSPVCVRTGIQGEIAAVPDGTGGAILAWEDQRFGNRDVYVQRLDSRGHPLWTVDGVAVVTDPAEQVTPKIAPDGLGGAIVAWEDFRTFTDDIYAQRISAAGVPLWTNGGVPVCTSSGKQDRLTIVADGAGGAIVAWSDYRSGDVDVYAQRVDSIGAVQWAANGITVVSTTNPQYGPEMASDGTGGAVIVWTDYRTGNQAGYGDLYAQRLSGAGVTQWAATGVAVCTAPGDQGPHRVAPSDGGGIIAVWQDRRGQPFADDIYAQRLDGSGTTLWTQNGIVVCGAAYSQSIPDVASDGSGGAIIAWKDFRSFSNQDIFAQRINADSTAAWASNGIAVCASVGDQDNPRIVTDGSGGAIVCWDDPRSGTRDVYAQRLTGGGSVTWSANGTVVTAANGNQTVPSIVTDMAEGGIVAWIDTRGGADDVYAARVSPQLGTSITGAQLPTVPGVTQLRLAQNRPNPFNPSTELDFVVPSEGFTQLQVFNANGRLVRTLFAGHLPRGAHSARWDGVDGQGRVVASGVYYARVEHAGLAATCRVTLLR